MIPKRSTAAFWDNELPTSQLLEVSSKGLSKDQLEKIGSDRHAFGSDIKPEKGFTFLHVITNGAGDYYGQNTNLDYFNEKEGSYTFPHPKKGIEKTARLKGGLEEFHKTYRKFGGVYRNHKNSRKVDPETGKPFEKQGSVADEWYNPTMHRGEVIVKLPTNKWTDVIDKLANNEIVTWSMGAAVPYETCGNCGNVAKKLKDRCPCLRADFHKIGEDGHVNFAINDETYYHDISEVGTNPAMKIAHTLEKVAASGMAPRKQEYNELGLWLPADVVREMATKEELHRYAILQKLAKAEKEDNPAREDIKEAVEKTDDEEKDISNKLSGIPLDELFSTLHSNQMLLSPKSFSVILIRSGKPGASSDEIENISNGVPDKLQNIFSSLLGSPEDTDEVCTDGHYCPHCKYPGVGNMAKVRDVSEDLSVKPEALRKKVIVKVIKGKSSEKMEKKACCSPVEDRMAQVVAKEYAKYQVAFLAANKGPYDFSEVVLAHNR